MRTGHADYRTNACFQISNDAPASTLVKIYEHVVETSCLDSERSPITALSAPNYLVKRKEVDDSCGVDRLLISRFTVLAVSQKAVPE